MMAGFFFDFIISRYCNIDALARPGNFRIQDLESLREKTQYVSFENLNEITFKVTFFVEN